MTEAFANFEFEPTSPSQAVPEWMWGKPLRARIGVNDLAELFGPVGNATCDEVAKANMIALQAAARRKVERREYRPEEPVTLTLADFEI